MRISIQLGRPATASIWMNEMEFVEIPPLEMQLPNEAMKYFFCKEPEKQEILGFRDLDSELVTRLMESAHWDVDFFSMESKLSILLQNDVLRGVFGGASVVILM